MTNLTDYFRLKRTGIYSHPLNSNDKLPLVYGDLSDGTDGIWPLPCIDTVNHVYCFSGAPVLSVAGGNSINIYADGVLVSPADYTFNASNDYEAQDAVAIVTFTADQKNAEISARGKGIISGGALLVNIVDIIDDLLIVQLPDPFDSSLYDATRKAASKAIFNSQAYKAAGVIYEDAPIWDIVQQMMGSFLGCAFLTGDKELALEIDDGVVRAYPPAAIIRGCDISFNEVSKQRSIDLISRCPADFAYDYIGEKFKSHSTGETTENVPSQGIYGLQEPTDPYSLYWVRDLATTEKIQAIVVAKFKEPIWDMDISDFSLRHPHVDVGDFIALSADWLYDKTGSSLINEIWKVTTVSPEFSAAKILFRGLDTGRFLLLDPPLLDGSFELGGDTILGGGRDSTLY